MKFTSAASILTLVAISAAAKTFSVITVRSGSQYQYNSVNTQDGFLTAGANGDSTVQFILNDDSTLVDHETKKHITVNADKFVVEGDQPSTEFTVDGDHLVYQGKSVFAVGKDNKLTIGEGTGVELHVVGLQDAANQY